MRLPNESGSVEQTMGGKTVARDARFLRTGGSYSYLLLPRKKTLEVCVILAQKLSLHQHHD